jgi:hypothetical protein
LTSPFETEVNGALPGARERQADLVAVGELAQRGLHGRVL